MKLYGLEDIPEGWEFIYLTRDGCTLTNGTEVVIVTWEKSATLALHKAVQTAKGEI